MPVGENRHVESCDRSYVIYDLSPTLVWSPVVFHSHKNHGRDGFKPTLFPPSVSFELYAQVFESLKSDHVHFEV